MSTQLRQSQCISIENIALLSVNDRQTIPTRAPVSVRDEQVERLVAVINIQ